MNLSRRSFLQLAPIALLGHGSRVYSEDAHHEFCTISYNVLAFRGYPRTPSNRDNFDAHSGGNPETTAKALASYTPSLVTLQEGPSKPLVERFAKTLDMNYTYFPGGWPGNAQYPGGFPGAVISKYPIIESENRPSAGTPHIEELFTRHLGRALLDTPMGKVTVISTHFHASDHAVRMREAAAIIALVDEWKTKGPVLLQGDLNHKPEDPEYTLWLNAGLIDIGNKHETGQVPTYSSTRPNQHIDYIWATPDLAKLSHSAAVLNKNPFIPDSQNELSYALSDHMPVMACFKS